MSRRGMVPSRLQEEVAKNKRVLDEAALKSVLAGKAGRRVMFRIIEEIAGVSSISFTGNSETFYREGRRSVGAELMREIQTLCPGEFMQMLNEASDERVAVRARLDSQESDDE